MLLGRAHFSILDRQPYPLSFVTVSGAHLYGFPSEDSDFDLRGVHVTPPAPLLSLRPPRETIEDQSTADGPLDELVTHDARKHVQHYLGFARSEWTLFHRQPEKTVKRLLSVMTESHEQSTLPDETPGARDALDAFLRELRFNPESPTA